MNRTFYFGIDKKRIAGYFFLGVFVLLIFLAFSFRGKIVEVVGGQRAPMLEIEIAQEGIDFVKTEQSRIFKYLSADLIAEVAKKSEDRYYAPYIPQQEIYGYKDAAGSIVIGKDVASDSEAFRNSSLQIICAIDPKISFTPSDTPTTPDDGRFYLNASIVVSSIGRVLGDSSFTDLPQKEQVLSLDTFFQSSAIFTGDPQNYTATEMLVNGITLEPSSGT